MCLQCHRTCHDLDYLFHILLQPFLHAINRGYSVDQVFGSVSLSITINGLFYEVIVPYISESPESVSKQVP